MFYYNATHQVVVCQACQSGILPGARSQERHLRAQRHRLSGAVLQATLQQLRGYELRTVDQLRQATRQPGYSCPTLPHLASYAGLRCLQDQCSFKTRHIAAIKIHVAARHQIKATDHGPGRPLWQACQIQTYFTAKGCIDYFEVTGPAATGPSQSQDSGSGSVDSNSLPLAIPTATTTAAQRALFASIEQDASTIQQDVDRQAIIVQDLNASRTERVPWLEKTGFPAYLAGLQDSQIKSAYKLPPKDPAKATDSDRDLARILATV